MDLQDSSSDDKNLDIHEKNAKETFGKNRRMQSMASSNRGDASNRSE